MEYQIKKDKHYFAMMSPIDYILPFGICITSAGKETWCECKIVEDRYKLEEGYKVTLQPLDIRFSSRNFYQSDFESLIKAGVIQEKVKDSQHVEYVEWYENVTPYVKIIHSGFVIVD